MAEVSTPGSSGVRTPVPALVGLGASFGDRRKHLRLAVAALHANRATEVVRVSRVVWSRGLGPAKGPFLNGVVRLSTSLSPDALLRLCKNIEQRLCRRAAQRWGDRAVDLDVLLWNGAVIDSPHLQVPHREMLRRAFVVVPAREVAGDLVHPVVGCRVEQLAVPPGMRVWRASGVGGRLARAGTCSRA